MPGREPRRSTDWRRRREEYLRASGRRDALIAEGYESAGLREWVVIRGGRRGRPDPESGCIRLHLAKGASRDQVGS